ncbi:MAG: aminoglycoside phosphotransferase family protein [Alphaproteobacteria bacterium]|nr:aminoglycoside phosphotransferase family protein [Alphaproteobacteria bacterium]
MSDDINQKYNFDWNKGKSIGEGNLSEVREVLDEVTGEVYIVHRMNERGKCESKQDWLQVKHYAKVISDYAIELTSDIEGVVIPPIYEIVSDKKCCPYSVMAKVNVMGQGNKGQAIDKDNIHVLAKFLNRIHQSSVEKAEELKTSRVLDRSPRYNNLMSAIGLDSMQEEIWGYGNMFSEAFCHNDSHPDNIVKDEDGNLCVLDWDFAGVAPVFAEINFLYSYLDWDTAKAFEEEYNSQEKPRRDLRVCPEMFVFSSFDNLSNSLKFLSWCDKRGCLEEGLEKAREGLNKVLNCLDRIGEKDLKEQLVGLVNEQASPYVVMSADKQSAENNKPVKKAKPLKMYSI